jgi:transforming growth factor-beta-induced protein
MKKQVRFLSVVALFALVLAACSGTTESTTTTEAPAEETSVVDLAISAGGFSTLVAAIEAAGLLETLEGEGPFTIFAPTDEAFETAFDQLGITAEELLADTETLTSILTYHVLAQAADSQLVSTLDGESVATVNGAEVAISIVDGSVMINDATVVSADLEADNGIVHVINSVLLPPDFEMMEDTTTTTMDDTTTTTLQDASNTIADIVTGNEDFSILLAAVEAAGLTDALADPDATLTVFAPTNEAFEAAFEALGITPEELLEDIETLTAILTYHVLGDVVTSEDIANAGLEEIPVETLSGEELVVVVGDDGSVSFKDQTAMVVQADVEADNGVIHVIDAVLLPPAA